MAEADLGLLAQTARLPDMAVVIARMFVPMLGESHKDFTLRAESAGRRQGHIWERSSYGVEVYKIVEVVQRLGCSAFGTASAGLDAIETTDALLRHASVLPGFGPAEARLVAMEENT